MCDTTDTRMGWVRVRTIRVKTKNKGRKKTHTKKKKKTDLLDAALSVLQRAKLSSNGSETERAVTRRSL